MRIQGHEIEISNRDKVFFPGAGSELYRGLGSVVIGGLALSTVFTLFLIPALFSLVYSLGIRMKRFGTGSSRPDVTGNGGQRKPGNTGQGRP